MNFIENVLSQIKMMGRETFSVRELAKFLNYESSFELQALEKALRTLAHDKKLYRAGKGRFGLVPELPTLKCKIFGTSKDYAFARPLNATEFDKDIFISVANLNDACHGDIALVEVGVSGKDRKYRRELPVAANGRQEGRVVEILERGFKTIVGIFSKNQRGIATVLPDDRRFSDSVFIAEADTLSAQNNTKVVVEILDYPSPIKMARGRVIEVLGDPNDVRVATLSIIRSFGLFETFPDEVIAEAKSVCKSVEEEDKRGRKDFRDRLIFTIDGDDARDFDDAISLTEDGDVFHLGVYIADVSHYVRVGSKLNEEAFKRGTSVYFPDAVLPMLPKELSNGICSLNPNEDRFVLAVEMDVDHFGKVINYEINKGIIRSKYRMTYAKVTKILNGDSALCKEYGELVPVLAKMSELAKILIARRDNAGQLDFDIPEPEIIMNADGTVKDIHRKPRDMSDRLIEQFMVLTNEVVARHFDNMKVPFVYRVHETPILAKLQRFKGFVASLGLKFVYNGANPSPKDFQIILKKSEGQDYSTALSKVMLRSMQKARYEVENLGHFGLALRDYCHFTSPIRRYPDLVIHQIISEIVGGTMTDKKLEMFESYVAKAAERSSTTERQAEEAERTVDDQKATEFMQTKIGEEYEGVISGVTEHGFYVELDSTIEGFVAASSLQAGTYVFDENRYALSGMGQTYKIGQRVKIKVESTDIALRHINFVLA